MYYRWMSMTATTFVALMVVTGETAPPTKLNFPNGFADTTGLVLNGNAEVSQPNLCLTVGGAQGQAGSAFSAAAVPVGKFRTSFQFSLAGGDGITLTLQGFGSNALGGGGGGLGYTGIGTSVAVKFDRFNNELQSTDSLIGLYTNGEEPTGGPTEAVTFPLDIDEGSLRSI
jgi:Bacterial lectin